MTSPVELMDKVAPEGKKEVAHKGKLLFESERFSGSFDVSFHEAPVEPLLELEGRVVKLGPNGHEIETRRPYINLEDGVEIKGDEMIKKILRYDDGSEDAFFNLPKTKVFRISDVLVKSQLRSARSGRFSQGFLNRPAAVAPLRRELALSA